MHARWWNETRKKMSSLVGDRQFGRHLRDNLVVRVIASQKLPRHSGESIFAARHLDVSQGPLGDFPEKPALLQNPPGFPTEFMLSAIQDPTEFH